MAVWDYRGGRIARTALSDVAFPVVDSTINHWQRFRCQCLFFSLRSDCRSDDRRKSFEEVGTALAMEMTFRHGS